jgi:hypothetical protein
MGPLLIGGGGGGSSVFFVGLFGSVGDEWLPAAIICESECVSVTEESMVVLREMEVDEERESEVYGFGADAKFLNEGSDMRGAFHGKRRITIQLRQQ